MWVRRTGLKCLEMAGYVAAGYALVCLIVFLACYVIILIFLAPLLALASALEEQPCLPLSGCGRKYTRC